LSTVPPAGWRRRRGRPGGSTPSCGTKRTGVLAAAEKGGTFSPTAAPTYAPTALPLRPHVSAGAHGWCAYGSTRARAEWGDARICVGDAPRRGTRRAHTWVLPSDTPKGYSPYSHLGTSVRHPEGLLAVLTPGYFRPTLPHRTVRRYGACPMGTAGTPPACAQCETGYAPPRLPGALPNRDSLLRLAAPVGLRWRDSVGSLGSLP
jgi:hypothetical protein